MGTIINILVGVVLTLLVMYSLYLRGANDLLQTQLMEVGDRLLADNNANKLLTAALNDAKKPFLIQINDDQAIKIGHIISRACKNIYDAEQAAALQKLS